MDSCRQFVAKGELGPMNCRDLRRGGRPVREDCLLQPGEGRIRDPLHSYRHVRVSVVKQRHGKRDRESRVVVAVTANNAQCRLGIALRLVKRSAPLPHTVVQEVLGEII